MDEVVRNCIKLKSITNNFFNKFTQHVQQNNRSEQLGVLYNTLLGFGITMVVDILKCDGQ